ncbi:beta-glucosidase [Povalibacter uvarum]|uniref:Beta-glucosidase n=1 Tax=Povalibacter uvarum TaxID=732238 RepID=A0A841HS62_9GAMM|nr:exo 1,3/1,4-beta-D-glucan glucohydrolase [Povalibacter uvarum]MBB6094862.1 beta-glucosidase [Povalibacter uvarum]
MNALRVCIAAVCAALTVSAASAAERGVANPELWPTAHSQGLIDPKTEAFITDLLTKMSLEEKVGQMVQGDTSATTPEDLRRYPLGSILAGGNSPPLGSDDRAPASDWIKAAQAFRAVSLEKRAGHTPIPVIFGVDAVHGNSNVVGATIFPHNSALGAARDPDLIRRIGAATAAETAAAGIDWAFAPTVAVPQDDRWGRAYEGYSESPDLVREYARAMVLGLQGEPADRGLIQKGHVAASVKHFLGDGGTKNGIDQGDTDVSEQDFIRIHGAGYPAAIDAGALTVMASYSSWQGVKMHGNHSLLTDVLKGRMGFEGFVVGDWNGHGQVPGCTEENCAAAILAGVDMLMAPASWKGIFNNTLEQVRSGKIAQARIDDAVRRILRVKAKLGLFENERPFEGRSNVLGSPEHRALAREAVRKTLVLLKNNGNVLPIKGSARVLVAGSGADDIGQQSGGWTLSWQGTGNKNSDFPNGQSIHAGLKEALERSGGSAELSVKGAFKTKPDVAIVVFGETPYAEMQGDIRTLEYQPGDKRDLALLQKLRKEGVPVVSVFLSGRPLWVNPELNASDAFVAAWLPGSEGGGIADVLIGDASGKPRNDFHGKLSFSWPQSAAQTNLNYGRQPYDPLFEYGYGLTYKDRRDVAALSEESGVGAADWNIDKYFAAGRLHAPWQFVVDPRNDKVLSVRNVDAGGVQEAGRQFVWSGTGKGSVALRGTAPIDVARQSNADLAVLVEYRVDARPTSSVQLALTCGDRCGSTLDLTPVLTAAPLGQWQKLKVKLADFRKAGADMSRVVEPFVIRTTGQLTLTLQTVRLDSDSQGTTTLRPAS